MCHSFWQANNKRREEAADIKCNEKTELQCKTSNKTPMSSCRPRIVKHVLVQNLAYRVHPCSLTLQTYKTNSIEQSSSWTANIVSQLVNKFPTFSGIRRFITVYDFALKAALYNEVFQGDQQYKNGVGIQSFGECVRLHHQGRLRHSSIPDDGSTESLRNVGYQLRFLTVIVWEDSLQWLPCTHEAAVGPYREKKS